MQDPLSNYIIPHAPEIPIKRDVITYTQFAGTFEPWEYTDWIDESLSWKETCYIGDWSPLGKFHVKGPDALRFFSHIGVNSFARFDVGQAKHCIFCNPGGKMMGEGILLRLDGDEFLFTSGPGVLWADYMFRKGNCKATVTRPRRFIFQVQGPNSLYVLEKVTGESLRDIEFMRFRKTKIKGAEILVLRQGMAGELGYELFGPSEQGAEVYNTILEGGQEFGIRRLGGRTKMVNHVEACYPTPSVDYIPAIFDDKRFVEYLSASAPDYFRRLNLKGGSLDCSDMSELYRSPMEMGWGKNVKFDHDFVGREALEEEARNPRRTMATLVWNSDDVIDVYASMYKKGEPYQYMEIPRNLLGGIIPDRVIKERKVVGVATSRCYSYTFREMLSLCTLDVGLCKTGTEVSVIWGQRGKPQKSIRATVAPAPYKADKRRMDVTKLPSYLT